MTAAASAGVLALPIGACRIGHLRFSRSVTAFFGHIGVILPSCGKSGVTRAELITRIVLPPS